MPRLKLVYNHDMPPASLLARLGEPAQTLYLLDISSFIFRAFFAVRPLHTRSGEPANAVYGVATMLARLAEEGKPQNLVVVYDSKEGSNRKEIYPEYKANRSAPPDDLVPQFDRIEEMVRCFEIHSYRQSGIEADDLIATLTRKWTAASPEHRVVIVSSDKDLMQLVNARVQVWDTLSNKIYGIPEVKEKFGIGPEQVRDYLALVGDSSDNIPGVPGVGPKTAVDLLTAHGTLEGVLAAAKAGGIAGKKGQVIAANEENARISARLATVHEDLPIELDPHFVKYRFHVSESCADFLRRMDFHSLLARWTGAPKPEAPKAGAGAEAETGAEAEAPASTTEGVLRLGGGGLKQDFRTINTEPELDRLLEAIDRRKEFGFDLETTSLNPREAELVGFALCHDPAFGCYIPVGHRGTSVAQLPAGLVLEKLKPFLENPRFKKIGQNLKYDWSVLYRQGLKPDGIGADTMVAAYVLDSEGRHNLQTLAAQYLDYDVMTYEQVCGKGADQLGFDQVPIDLATRYSAEDAWISAHLWRRLQDRLEQERLMDVFARVDLPLVDILARMELQGVSIDVDYLRSLSSEFQKELHAIEQRVQVHTQGPVNLNSPKQLAKLLFEDLKLPPQGKTKTGYSTDASVLEALAPLHEVPRLLLEYREISKLKGTYVDPLPLLRDPTDAKIHTSFHQAVTATGRLSSSDPNLQNIPIRTERGRKIRRAFVPSSGNELVAADYSQIELRILAHMSGDAELVRSFQADEDVHRRTASEIFGVIPSEVGERQRGIAKAINFGLMYGKTPFGLSQELKIPRKEAQDIIDRYFTRYSGVKRFLDRQVQDARENGFVLTELGRKRKLPDIQSRNPAIRGNAERMAMNTPIQGTAADLMKLAMIGIDAELQKGGYASKLIIQVHDEVVLDCPRAEVAEVEKLISRVMESAATLRVPLRVNAGHAPNWMDL